MVDTPTLTEFGLPALTTVGDDVSTTALMRQRAADHPGRLYRQYKSAAGSWIPVTLSQFAEHVTAVLSDGWFATGDLGSLDSDGYLRITGRKKEIIVTDAGKNVQPAGLEDAIRPDPIIREVIVVGDGRPFIGALISLDTQMLRA